MGRESAEKANRSLRSLLLALLSAALLIVAFPNFNQPWCAWIAFVPWLFLLRAVSRRAAFWWSYGIGLAFFLASMWWLIHVTVIGWLVLCACLALYFAVFGLIASRFFIHHPSSIIQRALLVPSAWVALEFLRSHLFSGLGWNLLAYSQTGWLPLIQIADLTGVWGVSFLIVMGNVALAELFTRGIPPAARWKSAAVAAVGVLLALGYGAWRISRLAGSGMLRVAVLQGNIPHDQTWDEAYRDSTLQRYQALTERAAATRPDVIVWPETTVPGYLGVDEEITQRVTALARQVRCPLLVGAPAPTIHDERITLMNSATLIDALGNLVARYDKMHLVAFGEFVPFDTWLPWLRGLLPPIGEFSPGHEYTVFHMGSGLRAQGSGQQIGPQPTAHSPELSFSVLICFEDVFPELARRFVRRGAQALLVITNDAWFGPTAAAYQHAQASTFRAVELRVPVARAANTGWSGCIDASGRWIGSVHDESGRALFVEGTHTCELPIPDGSSFYRQWGDWFAGLCVIVTVAWLAAHRWLFAQTHPGEEAT